MADYREISQSYAKAAINTALIINAGAALALLSQISDLQDSGLIQRVRFSMEVWTFGIGSAAIALVMGFMSSRYVDKSERETTKARTNLVFANISMIAGILLVLGSIWCFMYGAWRLAEAFPSLTQIDS